MTAGESSMTTTLVSSDGSPYLRWQLELLALSHRRAGQPGPLLVLRDTLAVPGDDYAPYNKPHALLGWARANRAAGTVVVLDPDMVFAAPWSPAVAPGHVVAHDSRYRASGPVAAALRAHTADPVALRPPSMPLAIDAGDLAALAEVWRDATLALRADPFARATLGWICEMWACAIAIERLGLRVSFRRLAAHPPFDRALQEPFVHYAYAVDGWDKRDYVPWAPMPEADNAPYAFVRGLVNERRRSRV